MHTKKDVLKFVRFRLDDYHEDKNFSDEMLEEFLLAAITEFNAIPPFTNVTFADEKELVRLMTPYVARLMVIYSLASTSLDTVINETAMSQYNKEYDMLMNNIRDVKERLNNRIYSKTYSLQLQLAQSKSE
jgi:hypothetical protein